MAYKISYDHGKRPATSLRKGRFALYTMCFFLLFLLMANWLVPSQLAQLRYLLTGSADLDALLQDLRQGSSLSQAVAAFCQDVLHGQ